MTLNYEVTICSKSCSYLRDSFLWLPKKQKNPNKWFYVKISIFLSLSFLAAFTPLVFHCYKLLERNMDPSEDLYYIISYTGFVTVMIIYAKNVKKISYLFKQLSDLKNFGKPPGFDNWNRKFDLVAVGLYYYLLVGASGVTIAKLLTIPKCKSQTDFVICGIMIPFSLPWKINSWLLLGFIDLYVVYFALIINTALFFTILQLFEVTINIKLRIDHLNEMLLKCFDENNNTKRSEENLVNCIRYHNYIINCSNLFKTCFTNAMCSLIVTMALSCGCLESQIVQLDFIAVVLIFGWVCLLFTACTAGQILIDASLSISDASYNSKWYETDLRLRKYLILVMMRSQRSLVLSAGPFNILCFELFVAIMKFSYSVFMLLNQN